MYQAITLLVTITKLNNTISTWTLTLYSRRLLPTRELRVRKQRYYKERSSDPLRFRSQSVAGAKLGAARSLKLEGLPARYYSLHYGDFTRNLRFL